MDGTAAREEDVEKLFQDALVGDGGANEDCHQVDVGIGQISQVTTLSSLNYDELNDDTLLFASEWNLATEDFGDDEDILVVSQPNVNVNADDDEADNPASEKTPKQSQRYPFHRSVPMISSEDDDTLLDSVNNIVSLEIDRQLVEDDSKLDIRQFKSDSEEEEDEDAKLEGVDEVEASRRYLTINSAPLYRWSEGMLPSISKQRLLQQQDRAAKEDDDDDETEYLGANSEFLNQEEEKSMFIDSVQNGPSIPAFGEAGHPKPVQPNSLKSPWIVERLKHLAKAYSDRTTFVKNAIENLSDSEDSDSSGDETDSRSADERKKENFTFESIFGDEWDSQDRFYNEMAEKVGRIRQGVNATSPFWYRAWIALLVFAYRLWATLTGVFEPQSWLYISWLFVLANAFCYNAIITLFRAVFPYELESGTTLFLVLDCLFDAFYLLDLLWFKPHLKYIQDGQWIDDHRLTRQHYFRQRQFRYDLAAIIPFDLVLWLYFGGYNVRPALQRLSRLNRMLKVDSFWEFFTRIDAVTTKFAYLFRIVHTLCYKMYIIHLGACAYYLSSAYEGFGATPWTYDNEGNAYLRCFYFAFRTTTSIGGRLPKPNNLFERIYMTIAWLLGVFVFAMVIGQIRDIVANAARDQDHYRDVLNKTANYMRVLSVPAYVQNRVRFWLNFTWDLQKTFDEGQILRVLPLKSRTDIALSVHYQTLARVELFKNIDRNVLRDLVLKLRPILFLPDDYVCRRGDVGHEMYIVNKGKIQVLGADGSVLIALGEGCVFGEIAILNLEGFTRRTADVRSVGYSQLFALTKSDLWETLKNYPEYQAVLKRKVQRILRKKRAQQNRDQKRSRRRKALKSRQPTVEQEEGKDNAEVSGLPELDRGGEIALQIVPDGSTIPTVDIVAATEEDEDDEETRDRVNDELEYNDDEDDEVFGVANGIEVESIVKDRPKTPKLFDAVMEVVRPDSKVKGYFSRSQSIGSTYLGHSISLEDEECKIRVEDTDPVM